MQDHKEKHEHNVKRNRKRKIRVLAILLLVVGLAIFASYTRFFDGENTLTEVTGKVVSTGTREPSVVKKTTESVSLDKNALLSTGFVKDLPSSATIALKLGDSYFTVKKNSIVAGKPSEPDLTISLPASYASQVSSDLCETVQSANQKGDLVIETHLSQTSLLWKYKGMLKYRECLG